MKRWHQPSSPSVCRRGAFVDLSCCKQKTNNKNRFPTTTFGNENKKEEVVTDRYNKKHPGKGKFLGVIISCLLNLFGGNAAR